MADSILRLKVESQEYDAKLKRASDGIQKYATECRKVGGTLTVVEKETLAFVQGLGKMETVSRSAKGSIGEMTKTFTDLSVQYKRLTDEEKKSPFGKAMSQSLDQLKTRIKDSKEELQSIEKELGGASMKTGDLSSVFGELGSRLGINSDLMGAVTTGTIGMTAAITAGTAAVAAAAKAWADYNSELAKQDQITTVTTGLKGADADKMTDAARSIAEVYGTDFREVINAANTLMTQFGESGDNAIQLIRDGMQGMIQGDGGKLLSMIQQYAPSFRDAGIEASQLVAVIQNSEGGIFTDQNMNAIVFGIKNIRLMTKQTSEALAQLGIDGQEMSRKLSDGSLSIFEALKQVATKMQDLESGGKQAGEVMQAVFGRQGTMAGTNLAKAIAELNTNLEETKTQTGNVGQSLANLEQAQEGLNSAMRETFQMKGWEEMGNKIETHFIQKLTSIVKGLGVVIDNLDKVKYAVELIIPGLGSLDLAFTHMGVSGKRILEGLETAAWSLLGPIGMLANTLDAIGSGAATTMVGDIVKQNKDGLIKAAGLIGNIGGNAFGKTKGGGGSTPFAPPKKTGGRSGVGKNTISPAAQAELDMAKAAKEYHNQLANAQEKYNVGLITEEELQKTKLRLLEQLADKNLAAWNTSGLDKYLTSFTNFAKAAVNTREKLMSVDDILKQLDKDFPTAVTSGMESQSWAESMQSAFFGDTGFGNEEKTTALIKKLVVKGFENGIDMSGPAATLMEQLFEGMDIPDEQLKSFVDDLNQKLKEAGLSPISVDMDARDINDKEKSKNLLGDANKLIGGINGLSSGLQQIGFKIPENVTRLISVIQGVMSVIQSVQSIIQIVQGSNTIANTTAVAANTAAVSALIPAMYAAAASGWFPFANGGIVHAANGYVGGTNYSGDNVPALLNSGELVLNRAQQGVLADALMSEGTEGISSVPYVSGEQIVLGVNNHLKRSGKGEIVTTGMLKRMNLM